MSFYSVSSSVHPLGTLTEHSLCRSFRVDRSTIYSSVTSRFLSLFILILHINLIRLPVGPFLPPRPSVPGGFWSLVFSDFGWGVFLVSGPGFSIFLYLVVVWVLPGGWSHLNLAPSNASRFAIEFVEPVRGLVAACTPGYSRSAALAILLYFLFPLPRSCIALFLF